MGNVVDFPQHHGGHTGSIADRSAERVERVDALRAALAHNRPMTPADQKLVAEGVWKVLKRLDEQGFTKAQVLQKAGLAQKEDSTKWLSQYALDPDRLNNGKNVPRLNKKPRQYIRILEAAAELANTSSDESLLEVFGSTSLIASGNVQVVETEHEELARWLRDISRAAAVKHNLKSYFQDVVHSGNQLLVENEAEETSQNRLALSEIKLAFCKDRIDLDWPVPLHGSTEDARFHDHARSIPPYPSVLLGEWSIGDVGIFGWDTTDDPYHDKDGTFSFGGGMLCLYKAELRWCVVPVGPDMHPEPALRVKIGLSLPRPEIEDEYEDLHRLTFEGLDRIPTKEPMDVYARVSTNGYRMKCRLWSDGHTVPPLIDQYFPLSRSGHHHSCRFLPLTGTIAKDWFSLPAYDFGLQDWHPFDVPPHIRALGQPLFWKITADDFSPFEANTIAAGLDHCLSGKHDADLLDLLDARAGQFVKLFHEASATARTDRSRALAQLGARLRRARGHEPLSD